MSELTKEVIQLINKTCMKLYVIIFVLAAFATLELGVILYQAHKSYESTTAATGILEAEHTGGNVYNNMDIN